MKDTQLPTLLQTQPYRPAAHLKGAKDYEIPLTEYEESTLRKLHEQRTAVLNELLNIDSQQNEIRYGIMRRTGIDGVIYFRNHNLF